MRSEILVTFSAAILSYVAAQDAPVVSGNPHGVEYKAALPKQPFFSDAALAGNVKGYVSAVAAPGGKGVKFTVQFENFPKEGGPFLYHIHEMPATNGNCTSTLAHLDPYHRGETPACDASKPETCQVGDLSGKYGKINSDPYLAEYFDLYTSLRSDSPAFFGNRSIVVHYANKTRLTCANFAKLPVSGQVTKLVPTAGGSRTATDVPIATGAHNNTTSPHEGAGHHNVTHAPSPSGVVTATGIVSASGSPATVGSVGAGATSSIIPFPGAASGNKVPISLLSGVVAAMILYL
ncbi:cu [Trichoderma cornu-damae]|uniref:superoxide dismutase n=1 Tax=Trichoderma cornu-damae TaxID=654480 RepID=A0A9P8U002_9HYPO|nr:cu [Trichoderma cornu-damae]